MKIFFIPFNKKLLTILGIIILIIILFFSISSKILTTFKPIYQVESARDEIALTCNVVWGTEYIPMILDILKNEDTKMTFYIGGKWAEENPEELKKIHQGGHEIGNHGYDHKKHSKLNDIDNENEIINAEKAIEKIINEKTNLFAPPYGDINERTVEIAESLGYRVVMWNKDTIDWRDQDPQKIYDRVFKNKLQGGLVLMHPTDATVKALPAIIKDIKKQNVKLVKVSDLIKE